MRDLKAVLAAAAGPEQFAAAYLEYVAELLRGLDAGAIARLVGALEEARVSGATVFVLGNGGSAATASHMANDLAIRTGTDRPIGLRALALADAVPALTAVANDSGYERVFVSQLEVYFRPGDVLLAISASGNSPNVVAAAKWMKAQGGRVLALTGFDGGELRRIAEVTVHVDTPRGEYGPVEDVHLVLDHLATMWLAFSAQAAVTG